MRTHANDGGWKPSSRCGAPLPWDPATADDGGLRAPRLFWDNTTAVEAASVGPTSRPGMARAGAASDAAPPWAAGAPARAPVTPPWRAAATATEGPLQAGGEVVVEPAAGRLLDFLRLLLRLSARIDPAAAGGTRFPLAPSGGLTIAVPWAEGGEPVSGAGAGTG